MSKNITVISLSMRDTVFDPLVRKIISEEVDFLFEFKKNMKILSALLRSYFFLSFVSIDSIFHIFEISYEKSISFGNNFSSTVLKTVSFVKSDTTFLIVVTLIFY